MFGWCAVKEILLDCSGGSWLTGSGLSEEHTNWRSSAWIKKTVNYCARKEPIISHSLPLAATLFRCLVHKCGGFKKYTVYPLSQSAHGQHPLMKCLCYCDSSQALLCRLDHYAWLVVTEILRQEAQRCYRLLCLHPSACLCVTCKHTHLLV